MPYAKVRYATAAHSTKGADRLDASRGQIRSSSGRGEAGDVAGEVRSRAVPVRLARLHWQAYVPWTQFAKDLQLNPLTHSLGERFGSHIERPNCSMRPGNWRRYMESRVHFPRAHDPITGDPGRTANLTRGAICFAAAGRRA